MTVSRFRSRRPAAGSAAKWIVSGAFALALAGCITSGQGSYVVGEPYQIGSTWYQPREDFGYNEVGYAGVYGAEAAGRSTTTDGEAYRPDALAAAHRTLQLPSLVRITNLANDRSTVVRVNDRGPAAPDQIIAVTPRTAELLGFDSQALARVRVQILPTESMAVARLAGRGEGPQVAAAPFTPPQGAPPAEPPPPQAAPRTSVARAPLSAPLPAAPPPAAIPPAGAPTTIAPAAPLGAIGPAAAPAAGTRPAASAQMARAPAAPQADSPGESGLAASAQQAGAQAAADARAAALSRAVAEARGRYLAEHAGSDAGPPGRTQNYYVQAGTFSVQTNAVRLQSQLGRYGAAAVGRVTVNGGTMYRVRVGPFASLAQANQVLSQVIQAGVADDATVTRD